MSTPTIDQFLEEIAHILQAKDGLKLQQYLVIEPPLPPIYSALVNELRRFYPEVSQDQLEKRCSNMLPEDEEGAVGGSWPAFISFLVQYFAFIRDVNPDQLVETHDMLKSLLKYAAKDNTLKYTDHAIVNPSLRLAMRRWGLSSFQRSSHTLDYSLN